MVPTVNRTLVLGGTGFLGRHVCEKLQRAGHAITVPTRRTHHAKPIQHLPRLSVVQADVHQEAELMRLLPGHSAVVNLVAILHGDEARFEHTHVALPEKLARTCVASNVKRLVHVSALGVAPDGPSMYQRSKARGEQVLQQARLDLTILRPSVVFGQGDRFLNLFARLQALFPVVPLACAQARFQPVWVEDVAQAVVNALARTPPSPVIECAGPEVLTLADLVRLAGRHGSRQRPVIPLPKALGGLQAWLMELAPGEPLMSRDNLAAMAVDNVSSGQLPGLDLLGIRPASVHSVAPGYLGAQA
ncbi:MAG: complex I NDUFA9 subunit family protein [Burkholderiaceae bacterium]